MVKCIAVFCGSSLGSENVFKEQAALLGRRFAEENIILVYGGARYGLMGVIADEAVNKGGKVIGVLPHFLMQREAAHERLSELILVDTMHERKIEMYELCDGIIALPGGFGTLDELFEIITWAQLGLHNKPIGILNTNGFYNSLISLIEEMIKKDFVKKNTSDLLLISNEIEDLLTKMNNYKKQTFDRFITREKI